MWCILVTKRDLSLLFAHDFIGIQQTISWNPTKKFIRIQQELPLKKQDLIDSIVFLNCIPRVWPTFASFS